MTLRFTTLAVAASFALLGACESPSPTQKVPANTLVAVKTGSAPNPAAGAADPVWARALPLQVDLSDGANFGGTGATTATLRAAYSGDMLYMLVQYKDPTDSRRRGPYQKQADGSWKQLKSAANKGGDETEYYEDKWAFIWPIGNSIKGFDDQGCAALCHKGQGKPYGNKYSNAEGEIGDMWHFKGSRTAPMGHVDDQYVDHTRYDAKTSPNAGRKSDPGGPEYAGFGLVNGRPQYMHREARAFNAGGTQYIRRGEEVPFDDSRFKPGDEVAAYIVNPLQGDRADIRVVASWKDGVHTAVLSRKLVTGSRFDVQFDKLDARYALGFAAFDNAQVRHATGDDALFMVFGK